MADVALRNGDVDAQTWVWIPDVEPGSPVAREWAANVAAVIRPIASAEASDDALLSIAESVLTYRPPFDGVAARFWHVPRENATFGIASAYILLGVARDRDLTDLCLEGFTAGMLQRVRELAHPALGESVSTIAVAHVPGGSDLTVARWIGRRGDAVLMAEVLAPDPVRVAAMSSDTEALFRSLELCASDQA